MTSKEYYLKSRFTDDRIILKKFIVASKINLILETTQIIKIGDTMNFTNNKIYRLKCKSAKIEGKFIYYIFE